MPETQTLKSDPASDGAGVQDPRVVLIPAAQGDTCLDRLDGIDIQYYRSVHMGGAEFSSILHYLLVLRFSGKTVIFAADAESIPENFRALTKLGKIDLLFINPLFYQKKAGKQILDRLNVEQVAIDHVPFAGEDPTGLRMVAEKCVRSAQDLPYAVTLLEAQGQTLLL